MAYQPTDWKNREVERPRTFEMQNNPDGTITLIPSEGIVTEPGTPIMASNMNKIEGQLVALEHHVDNHLPGGIDPINTNALLDVRNTFFVDSLLGDDLSGDGSQDSPFKSLNHTLDIMAKVSTDFRTILLIGGSDRPKYPLTNSIKGFDGSQFSIEWYNPTEPGVKPVISGYTGMHLTNCSANIYIRGIEIEDAYTSCISIQGCSGSVHISNVTMVNHNVAEGGNAINGIIVDQAVAVIAECTISNTMVNALHVINGGTINEYATKGSANRTIFRADGSTIFRSNPPLITGDLLEEKWQGGQIYHTV